MFELWTYIDKISSATKFKQLSSIHFIIQIAITGKFLKDFKKIKLPKSSLQLLKVKGQVSLVYSLILGLNYFLIVHLRHVFTHLLISL